MNQSQSARPWYRKQLSRAIAGALACCAAPALAQQAEPADEASATNLDTVVVTANKRVENVRDVGASISDSATLSGATADAGGMA